MNFDPQKHQRRSIRLPGHDYSQPGAYFVTMNAYQREGLFGEIIDGKLILSPSGRIVWNVWHTLPARYPQITLGTAVVMPDHFHGILTINDSFVGAIHELPRQKIEPSSNDKLHERRRMTLPLVIGYFKMNSAKQINEILDSPGTHIWQRNYYEHIIRDDGDYHRVEQYIQANVSNWSNNEENPVNPPSIPSPNLKGGV